MNFAIFEIGKKEFVVIPRKRCDELSHVEQECRDADIAPKGRKVRLVGENEGGSARSRPPQVGSFVRDDKLIVVVVNSTSRMKCGASVIGNACTSTSARKRKRDAGGFSPSEYRPTQFDRSRSRGSQSDPSPQGERNRR